ncbi:hypothetical protein [Pantoea sp.]|uniref:hypothetical protein n=1 Tax=Pantoea sp. TaxID=69393 RepID=UPI0031D0531C
MKLPNYLALISLLFSTYGLAGSTFCSLSLSQHRIDYPLQSRWQLQQQAAGMQRSFGTQNVLLMANCSESQAIDLQILGTSGQYQTLLFGKKGILQVKVRDAHLDGKPVELMLQRGETMIPMSENKTLSLLSGDRLKAMEFGHVVTGKKLFMQLEIEPLLPSDELRVASLTTHEATLTLRLLPVL